MQDSNLLTWICEDLDNESDRLYVNPFVSVNYASISDYFPGVISNEDD